MRSGEIAMRIKLFGNSDGKTLRVYTDKCLDVSIHRIFSQVVDNPQVNDLEIDLRKTKIIRDSGLTMLSMLTNQSRLQREHIKLVNCRPRIRTQINNSFLVGRLQVL